ANMAAQPEQQVRQTLPRLIHAHLISEVGPGRYSWNRLVAAFAAEQADLNGSETPNHALRS
ncbi:MULTISPECIES: hypothetical protein, partial [unclassified Streptomyces]